VGERPENNTKRRMRKDVGAKEPLDLYPPQSVLRLGINRGGKGGLITLVSVIGRHQVTTFWVIFTKFNSMRISKMEKTWGRSKEKETLRCTTLHAVPSLLHTED